jgi:hypothetical protein
MTETQANATTLFLINYKYNISKEYCMINTVHSDNMLDIPILIY